MTRRRTRQVQRAEWDEQQFAAHFGDQIDEVLYEVDQVDLADLNRELLGDVGDALDDIAYPLSGKRNCLTIMRFG